MSLEERQLELEPVRGVRIASVAAGIKYPERLDAVLFELCSAAEVAAVFTQNAFCAAPVQVAKSNMNLTRPRYLLINTGNANAGTGERGIADARRSCEALAHATGCSAEAVLPFSTGVIGEPLPVDRLETAIPELLSGLSANGWVDAASGIMTTDTRPKGKSRSFDCDGVEYCVSGIAKGAGMIKPNMATMLAFIATDAAIEPGLLQEMLETAVAGSFNRISVDGDTSTNDACVLVASGEAGNPVVAVAEGSLFEKLQFELNILCLELAQELVRDGEGASKFVEVAVCGGGNETECLQVAYAVAESPLVKTALFASDPNWGRILAAIGYAGVENLDVGLVTVHIGATLIAAGGERAPSYTEEDGVLAMQDSELEIRIDLGRGEHSASVWTTDLGYDYVRINAEYRT